MDRFTDLLRQRGVHIEASESISIGGEKCSGNTSSDLCRSKDRHRYFLCISNGIKNKRFLHASRFEPTADVMVQMIYEIYAEVAAKNPFHTPKLPMRTEGIDANLREGFLECEVLVQVYGVSSQPTA